MKWDPEGKPRKPDLLGIGAQKAGTTWLSQMLSQHPDVWAPPFKEAQFFNHRFIEEHRKWLPWHFRQAVRETERRFRARGEDMPEAIASVGASSRWTQAPGPWSCPPPCGGRRPTSSAPR